MPESGSGTPLLHTGQNIVQKQGCLVGACCIFQRDLSERSEPGRHFYYCSPSIFIRPYTAVRGQKTCHFARAFGSHPYAVTSHGSGSFPIQQSDFPDLPLKIEYLKNPFFITFLIKKWPIWARSSAGSAKGSVFRLIYNFILLYSSVPLLELLIWARSSVWESVRFASVRSRVRSPSGPPHSGDLVLRSPEFFILSGCTIVHTLVPFGIGKRR